MNAEEQRVGSLERLGIEVEIHLPEELVTAGHLKSVRFRVQEPQGYAYGEVDEFLDSQVTPTIEWLLQALHNRNTDIHRLGREMDLAETNRLNMEQDLQKAQLQNNILSAQRDNEDDREMQAVLGKLQAAENEILRLKAEGAGSGEADTEELAAYVKQNEELRDYIEQVRLQYEELYENYQQAERAAQEWEARYNAFAASAGAGQPVPSAAEEPAYAEPEPQQYEEAQEEASYAEAETQPALTPEPEPAPEEPAQQDSDNSPLYLRLGRRTDGQSKYEGRKLPAGIRPEDLE